jgi:hypothetical protein
MSNQDLQTEFNSKLEIVQCLVKEWGYTQSSFYNSPTNKSVEKFWTYNRCLKHLFDLRENYIRSEYGRTHKSLEFSI